MSPEKDRVSMNYFGCVNFFSISLSCCPSTAHVLFLPLFSLWCFFKYLLINFFEANIRNRLKTSNSYAQSSLTQMNSMSDVLWLDWVLSCILIHWQKTFWRSSQHLSTAHWAEERREDNVKCSCDMKWSFNKTQSQRLHLKLRVV